MSYAIYETVLHRLPEPLFGGGGFRNASDSAVRGDGGNEEAAV
jgi:hypothetical protein